MKRPAGSVLPAFLESLSGLYDRREATNIFKLLMEDLIANRPYHSALVLDSRQLVLLESAVDRLKAGEPLQYITGVQFFYGYRIRVSQGVLIPRPETEELVHWILSSQGDGPISVLDIGTGSGCISIALALERPGWDLYAFDASSRAIEIAMVNNTDLKAAVTMSNADLFADNAVFEGVDFDLIVSNPPYVLRSDAGEMRDRVVRHEPGLALFVPDNDPLRYYRRISDFSLGRIRSGGWLYLECHERYAGAVRSLLSKDGWLEPEIRQDMRGKDRMLRARAK